MTFNDDASLDTSQVGDRRGIGGGGLALGGGGLGIVGVIIYLVINVLGGGDPTSGTGGLGVQSPFQPGQTGSVSQEELSGVCKTGADANARDDCRIVGYTNSVQAYWSKALGSRYRPAETIIFSGSVQTGCGNATTDVGPFYCPADGKAYFDLGFFDELTTRFGAKGGSFAQGYVVAHEYGHHIQNLLGTSDQVGSETGPQSGSVRLELQADCYAGAWAKNATTTTGANGKPLFASITANDISIALDAAASVGDDRIQSKAQGRVSPESFTHGTSAQRQKWFTTGYQTGNPNNCNTFKGNV